MALVSLGEILGSLLEEVTEVETRPDVRASEQIIDAAGERIDLPASDQLRIEDFSGCCSRCAGQGAVLVTREGVWMRLVCDCGRLERWTDKQGRQLTAAYRRTFDRPPSIPSGRDRAAGESGDLWSSSE